MASWKNCGNCGRTFDLNVLVAKRSKHAFCGATQYQKKCPCCKVALDTTVPEDEADQNRRIDPSILDEAVLTEMRRGKSSVKAAKAARVKLVKEAAALTAKK